jgi:hypothetical protein
MSDSPEKRFEEAVRAFDGLNAEDPNRVEVDGALRPRQLVESERLSRWVARLAPHASEALRLASRCQHLQRWQIPRNSYPDGRVGYLMWRKELSRFHANKAREVLASVGYDEATIDSVCRIVLKRSLSADVDTQTMEDALCLTFLEYDLTDFAARHVDDKVVEILKKTWGKMSPHGRELALRIELPLGVRGLVEHALAGADAHEGKDTTT